MINTAMQRLLSWLFALAAAVGVEAGEVLYNGIRLPEEWPPPDQKLTREPMPQPPYLIAPPEVVCIDVGRQLFVDDFLVESTTLERTHHLPEYHPASPVLSPDQPWELQSNVPHAAVFSDGVWYDPANRLFKMWYWAGIRNPDGYWNWGNVQSAGGGCLVVGDKLYFYVGGVSGAMGRFYPDPTHVGLAVLRRDGFTSMDAGEKEGTLTTRHLRFQGRHLFVNVDTPDGQLLVEVLDAEGNPIEPFTRDHCRPVRTDSTLHTVKWQTAGDLGKLAGQVVRLRFHLTDGRLYPELFITRAAACFGTIWGRFLSGAARAARFSHCNTGRLAPCRYKVKGIGLAPSG